MRPDIITGAKGLGNGLPIGLTIARPEVAESLKGVTLSTFGGNPVVTTAAKAVIDYVEEQNLLRNCEEVGGFLREKLMVLQDKFPVIGDVRGKGLLQALELVEDRESKTPAPELTLRLMEAARDNGVLVGRGGLYGNVLRFSPPMNISRSDVEEFSCRLEKSLGFTAAA